MLAVWFQLKVFQIWKSLISIYPKDATRKSEVGWLTQIRSLDQSQTCLLHYNGTWSNSLLWNSGSMGRWNRCYCVLSAGEPGLLLTLNSHSKYGFCFPGVLMSSCHTICPNWVHPRGVPLQTIYTSKVKDSKDLYFAITLLFKRQIFTRFPGYLWVWNLRQNSTGSRMDSYEKVVNISIEWGSV